MDNDRNQIDKRVCIVVLGDIGRSPRMSFHALSLAQEGFRVDLVGYEDSVPCQRLIEHENIVIHALSEVPQCTKNLQRYFQYAFKVIWTFICLLMKLLTITTPSVVLCQNPPAVPTLAVVWFYCWLKSSKMIVDWHNYGYTILGLTLGVSHPVVRFSKWFEFWFGKMADAHICVTKALKKDLEDKWGISATVMYDRPPDIFHQISIEDQHDLFQKLKTEYKCFAARNDDEPGTAFTAETDSGIVLRKDRPALLISTTSWTEDEDFSILLEALSAYDKEAADDQSQERNLPRLLCVITGKGPLKDYYAGQIAEKNFTHIEFCLPWLTAEDYPKLLASGDIGISLHTSSSGLDLPMKVVDMFGSGLPVLAYHFNCLSELVVNNHNGLVFRDAQELKDQMEKLLCNYPEHSRCLQSFRDNLKSFQALRWDECWKASALPLFQ